MTKEEWLMIRVRAVHRDMDMLDKAFSFYCDTKGLNPSRAEMRVIQNNLSVEALVKWVDIELGVNTITHGENTVLAF